ncbi:hypothetical protein AAP_02124 [Ascosphaera apis ARSEF 7405]|uniref:Uncharacterized protein n=1 Tax=Ascosphaera apis ARSEF 7405 TaxID=392613 RepID=A0A168AK87_9EURO|nr:hypothetical protein AAP_02124 [Ascosphaera apis ARSEF 7405]
MKLSTIFTLTAALFGTASQAMAPIEEEVMPPITRFLVLEHSRHPRSFSMSEYDKRNGAASSATLNLGYAMAAAGLVAIAI